MHTASLLSVLRIKRVDLRGQQVLFIIWILSIPASFTNEAWMFYTLCIGHLLMGTWQLLSTACHLFIKAPYRQKTARRIYYVLLLGIAIGCSCIGYWPDFKNIVLIRFTPLMAIYYYMICHLEYKALRMAYHRHLLPDPSNQLNPTQHEK